MSKETKYMKMMFASGRVMSVYKQTEEGVVAVYDDQISLYKYQTFNDDLYKEGSYEPATKNLFEAMRAETLKHLSSL